MPLLTRWAVVAALAATLTAADLRLVDAVKRRDPKAVASLLREKTDVNAAQPDGATALSWAIHFGDRATADMLLAAGANVNVANEYGETPLTLACLNGDAALVTKLLAAGADAKAARWNAETALMIAAGAGSVEAAAQLIAAGADVNTVESRKGQTALMWAAAEGHSAVVKLLIAKGADVKAVSKSGYTPVLFAAMKNDVASVWALIAAGADANVALPGGGGTALSVAASYASTGAAGALLDNGADPKLADRAGRTPLHIASQSGQVELARKLLAKGAALGTLTAPVARGSGGGFRGPAGGQSPLFLAARAGHIDVMRALLEAGADPKAKSPDGATFLMAAVGSAKVEAVKFAYQHDNDVKAATNDGTTLMHASVIGTANGATQEAQERVCDVIRFLAEKGAPVDELNSEGRTPIDLADGLPIDKAVDLFTELIVKSGIKPKSPTKR